MGLLRLEAAPRGVSVAAPDPFEAAESMVRAGLPVESCVLKRTTPYSPSSPGVLILVHAL